VTRRLRLGIVFVILVGCVAVAAFVWRWTHPAAPNNERLQISGADESGARPSGGFLAVSGTPVPLPTPGLKEEVSRLAARLAASQGEEAAALAGRLREIINRGNAHSEVVAAAVLPYCAPENPGYMFAMEVVAWTGVRSDEEVARLREVLRNDPKEAARIQAAIALYRTGTPAEKNEAVETLIAIVQETTDLPRSSAEDIGHNFWNRPAAVRLLAEWGVENGRRTVLDALWDEKSYHVRSTALYFTASGRLGREALPEARRAGLDMVAVLLGEKKGPLPLCPLGDARHRVAVQLGGTLGTLGFCADRATARAVARCAEHKAPLARRGYLNLLNGILHHRRDEFPQEAWPIVKRLTQDSDPEVARLAKEMFNLYGRR